MKTVHGAYMFRMIISLTMLAQSCTEYVLPEQPDSYLAILSRYRQGFNFMNADKSSDGATVFFDGGGCVNIGPDDFPVSNCCFKEPLDLELDETGAEWVLDGTATGIRYVPSATLEKACPVYAIYTESYFRLYASNGESICFYLDVDNPLLSFTFRKQFNQDLPDDIDMAIDGRTVHGTTSFTSPTLDLIPTFMIDADYVTVDGVRQVSSSSSQDFSKPVTYVVHKYNGDNVEYVVSFDFIKKLPVIRIDVDGGMDILSKTDYVNGTVIFEDYDRIYSDAQRLELRAGFKGRGNTTWSSFPQKRPYRIKLEESSPVFGIHKDKDWVLLAEYSDKTLLRNRTAMEISRICGMDWTPEMRSVNLFLNGAYKGVYTLCEHKEVSGHKVDIEIVSPSDNSGESLTGGYYLEIDTSKDQPVCFDTGLGIPIMFNEPENPTDAQLDYIREYLDGFESVLYSSTFADPVSGYRKYIDVESFINYYIIAELSKNIDGNLAKSCFLAKPCGERLRFCHTWDYDLAFGNCNYMNISYEGADNGPEGWFACCYIYPDYFTRKSSPGWFGRLMDDPAYVASLKQRWKEIYPRLKDIPAYIDSCVESLYGAENENFRLHKILGQQVWPNRVAYETYGEEVSYLKTFYSRRLEWMDKAISGL